MTFAISPEYFTRLKFAQFAWADFGWPPRVFAAEVGFLATAAVGVVVGWFLARCAFPQESGERARRMIGRGFGVVLLFGLLGSATGYVLGLRHTADYSEWQSLCDALGVVDVSAFVRVAYIHNAGYFGGALGLLSAIFWLRSKRARRNGGGGAG